MRSFPALTTVLAAFALTVCAAAADAPLTGRVVTLSASDITHLGLRIAPVTPAVHTPTVHGYGVVLDMGALATADAGVATAEAAARQSGADLKRARALYGQDGAMSKQALDAAQKQASSDETSVLLARRQQVVQFGANFPWHGEVLHELTSGRAILV